MQTIDKNLWNRLCAQAQEAKEQGLTKIATNLENQLTEIGNNGKIRDEKTKFSYSNESFEHDVHQALWSIAIRAADFYQKSFDSKKIQTIIEKTATDLISDLRIEISPDGVGANEPSIPGEEIDKVVMD